MTADADKTVYESFALGTLSKITVPARHIEDGDHFYVKKTDWDETLGIVYNGLLNTKEFGEGSAVERAYKKTQNGNPFTGRQINLLADGLSRVNEEKKIEGEGTYRLFTSGVWALMDFAKTLKEELKNYGSEAEREYFKPFFEKANVESFTSRLKDAFGFATKKAGEVAEQVPPAVEKLKKKFPVKFPKFKGPKKG